MLKPAVLRGGVSERRICRAEGARSRGDKKGGLSREIRDRVPDGVVAVVKGLLKDDDDPRVKARIQAVTRALQSPARLFTKGAAVASSVGLTSAPRRVVGIAIEARRCAGFRAVSQPAQRPNR